MIRLATGLALLTLIAGAAAASASRVHPARACGVERWAVKTLTDRDASTVNLRAKPTTVDALRSFARPSHLPGRRGPSIERTTYRLSATLVTAKVEADSDVHLVIADPRHASHTVIVELPSPSCTHGSATRVRKRMSRARRAFVGACGQPPSSRFGALSGKATITGVGFFDFKHGQRGVAPNAIELHPVLGFKSQNCRA
jgi:hypothetical protein